MNELLSNENLSLEVIKAVMDAAFIECIIKDDELIVSEAIKIRITLDNEREVIKFASYYGFTNSSSQLERTECANKINSEYMIVRAFAINDVLIFNYYLPTKGGFSKMLLVSLIKRFPTIVRSAASEHSCIE